VVEDLLLAFDVGGSGGIFFWRFVLLCSPSRAERGLVVWKAEALISVRQESFSNQVV